MFKTNQEFGKFDPATAGLKIRICFACLPQAGISIFEFRICST